MLELRQDLDPLQEKILGMAEAFDDAQYAWRPEERVRSSGEVFMHIAAVNYAFPMVAGTPAPAEAEMALDEFFPGIARFEATATSRDEILATLRASFEHLESAMVATTDDLERQLEFAGMETSARGFWWMHQGHLHEHLGQLIAYGRSNGVAPPWS